jgi:aryl-alcohol dehydrogenase-like predicted oxidoreductase
MAVENIIIGGSKFDTLSQKKLNQFLDYAISVGVYQIDTSPLYGNSEEMIGNYQKINPQLRITTKVGLPRALIDSWHSSEIEVQFQQSLNKLNIDKIDTLFFHSIPSKLLSEEIFSIAENFMTKELITNLGYSGDNENLQFAINLNKFDCFMATFNALDVSDYKLIRSLKMEKVYIKRPLANAVFNKTLLMTLKSKLSKLTTHNLKLYPNSYPSRYRQIFGEPKFINTDLLKFIQFLVYFQPHSKYVFGVRSCSHLKEIIKTYKLVNDQIIPELDEYLEKVIGLSQRLSWRALS